MAGITADWSSPISAGTPDTNGIDGYLLDMTGNAATAVLVLFDAAQPFGVGDKIIPADSTDTVANWQVMSLASSYQNNNVDAPLFSRPHAACSTIQFDNIP